MDVTMPEDKVRDASSAFLQRFNAAVLKLRSLLLIEDLVESLKFAAGSFFQINLVIDNQNKLNMY